MAASHARESRAVLRTLLRAIRVTFEGDRRAIDAARERVRVEFSQSCLDPAELQKRLQNGRDVALFLRRNLVQGVSKEGGNFKLRLHKDSELGDNTTVKVGRDKTSQLPADCQCSTSSKGKSSN